MSAGGASASIEGYHAASADQHVAGDPAEVERRTELERLLRDLHGEGQVGDGVHDEAGGDQAQGGPVGAAAADDEQQRHRREHDVEQREEQGRELRATGSPEGRRAARSRRAPRR